MAPLFVFYTRLVYLTSRYQVKVPAEGLGIEPTEPVIVCFWHGRTIFAALFNIAVRNGRVRQWRSDVSKSHCVISPDNEGALFADLTRGIGFGVVEGRTDHGGISATRRIARLLRGGAAIWITPDGPRGPRMHASEGVARLASMTSVPLVPIGCSCSLGKIMSSWDRFVLTYPFSRLVFVIGAPVWVAKGSGADEIEHARAQIEARLRAVNIEADRLCGRDPVLPDASIDNAVAE